MIQLIRQAISKILAGLGILFISAALMIDENTVHSIGSWLGYSKQDYEDEKENAP